MIKINPRKILGLEGSEIAPTAISESDIIISETKVVKDDATLIVPSESTLAAMVGACAVPCGMNYCDENGCVERKRHQVVEIPKSKFITAIDAAEKKSGIIRELWEKFGKVKRQRGKLSSSTAPMITDIVSRLSPEAAQALLNGDYCSEELKKHYAALQLLIDEGAQIYDEIRHVEQYGTLPDPAEDPIEVTSEEKAIQHDIRRLDDLIYKTQKKIEAMPLNGKPSKKINDWKEKVAMSMAKRDDLKQQLKRMQYEARSNK